MSRLVIENCAIATVDGAGTEYGAGHIVVEDGVITAIGRGKSGRDANPGRASKSVDGTGCLATPGLINTHHHLYQWATRGYAQDSTLFEWLVELYPVWSGIDEEVVGSAAGSALAMLALSGCTTSTDHHYVFPKGVGDLLAAEIEAAKTIGLRFHPTRGSMDLGESDGGLPPDSLVESTEDALKATAEAIDTFHDPSRESMLRIGVAPCSPFSVTGTLMTEAAKLARDKGVRLHTHLAETVEEDAYCLEKHGTTPAEYVESLGWIGDDVWFAHGVHLGEKAIKRFGETGTGVAHCPSSNARLGAGMAPVRQLLDVNAPVGLGVDGSASQEAAQLAPELKQALYNSRLRGGPKALTAREALAIGTMGGARCLGRQDEIGSLEVGKLADIALWRLDEFGPAGIEDPVAALVFGPPAPLALLLVNGNIVVERNELKTVEVHDLVRRSRRAARRLRKAHP